MSGGSMTRDRVADEYLVLVTVCLGLLVAQIDTSVVNLAMQPIGHAFAAPVSAMQWVLDGYNLSYAVLLLTGGLLADLFGRRAIFQVGAAIIGLASVACACAPDIGLLIGARIVAGLGSALMVPASLAIVRVFWDEPVRRRWALGVWASCNGLAFAVGPTIGGAMIGWLGWPSVFLLAVPLVIGALVMAGWSVPESSDRHQRRFDLPGQVLGAVALGALVFAAIEAHEGRSAWVAPVVLAGLAMPAFLLVEHRAGETALVPLALFRSGRFCGAIAATASMTFGIYGMIFLMPLMWQSSGLLTPIEAGLALLPCALVFFLVSPKSGALSARYGVRVMTAGGTGVIALGLLVLAVVHGLVLQEFGLLLTGIGMGMNTGPLMSVAVDAVTAARSGTAAALINVARMTGATLGVAVLGAVFAHWHAGGLQAAMVLGGLVQVAGAATAWLTIRG